MAAKKSAAPKPAAKGTKGAKTSKAVEQSSAKEKSFGGITSALAEKTGATKVQGKAFLEAHAALLIEELKTSGSVQLAGISKLKMGERAKRRERNPATGEATTIKAAKTFKFSGGKVFKDNLNA